MKPKVQALGVPVARERRDGAQIRISTFIPLKIRKRGARKVVVRPDGQVDDRGKLPQKSTSPCWWHWRGPSIGSTCWMTAWLTAAAKLHSARVCTIRR